MSKYLLPKVPSPYVLVEHIETTHTTLTNEAPVIKTNIIPNQDTICYIDYQQNQSYSRPSGGVWVFGARTSASAGEYGLVIGSDGYYASPYNTSSGNNTFKIDNSTVNNDANRHQFLFKVRENGGTSRRFDNQIVGSTTGQSYVTYSEFEADHGLWIFGCLDGDVDRQRVAMKLYSFKVWQGLDEELVSHMVPVKNTRTNEYGMFDLVTKQFYGNSGTGAFTGGDEIKQVEYLENSGTQYINAGITCKDTLSLSCKFQFTSSPGRNRVFGGRTGTTSYGNIELITYDSKYYIMFGKQPECIIDGLPIDTSAHTIDFKNGEQKLDNSIIATESYTFSNTTPIYLFGIYNSGSAVLGTLKVFSFAVSDGNNLVRNFIPVLVGTEYAMFDLVSSTVYRNAGTGAFTGGPVVNPPEIKKFVNEKVNEGISPYGYKLLEYIETTGTQYIDTGITPNQDTRAVLDCHIGTIESARYIGSSTDSGKSFAIGNNGTKLSVRYYSANAFEYTINAGRHLLDLNKNKLYVDKSLVNTFTYQTFTSNASLCICQYGAQSIYFGRIKIYSSQIYNDGTLVRNFIPVQRISDNAIGMYDKVSKQFYGNSGSGVFTAGPQIKQVEYVEIGDTQYLNTGIKPTVNTKAEFKFAALTDSVINLRLIGSNFPGLLVSGSNTTLFVNSANYSDIPIGSIVDGNIHTMDIHSNVCILDGVSHTVDSVVASNSYIYINTLDVSPFQRMGHTRWYSCKITDNEVVKRNFIPVLVGTEYAMFDTVEWTVYRNAGTGSFTGGSEVSEGGKYLSIKELETDINIPGYERLEYIQSTGTQYIDTRYETTDNTEDVYIKAAFTEAVSYQGIFESNVSGFGRIQQSGSSKYFRLFNLGIGSLGSFEYNEPFEIWLGNGTFKVNNDSATYTVGSETSGTFRLFMGGYNAKAKLYHATIKKGSSVAMDLYPVKRISDNAIGMYDRVNKKFYGNSGTGTFVSGPTIKEVEYIDSGADRAFIITDFTPTVNTDIEVLAQKTGGTSLFGADTNTFTITGSGSTTTCYCCGASSSFANDDLTKKIYSFIGNTVTNGMETKTVTRGTTAPRYPLALFARSTSNTTVNDAAQNEKIWYVKIWDNNILVRNFIPVKVGTEYAMFDTVTQSVFRNSGSAVFTGGNEVKSYKLFIGTKEV